MLAGGEGLAGRACAGAPHVPDSCVPLQLHVLWRTDVPVHGLADYDAPLPLAVPPPAAGWLAEAVLAAVLAVASLPLLLLTQTTKPCG